MSLISQKNFKKNKLFACWKSTEISDKNPEHTLNYAKNRKYKRGRWDKEEHERFMNACYLFGEKWDKIEDFIQTRSVAQIRSHAQKYLIKLCKKYSFKLKTKKFKNRASKHLDSVNNRVYPKLSINLMNDYDKTIFNMFRYYTREIDNEQESADTLIPVHNSDLKPLTTANANFQLAENPTIDKPSIELNQKPKEQETSLVMTNQSELSILSKPKDIQNIDPNIINDEDLETKIFYNTLLNASKQCCNNFNTFYHIPNLSFEQNNLLSPYICNYPLLYIQNFLASQDRFLNYPVNFDHHQLLSNIGGNNNFNMNFNFGGVENLYNPNSNSTNNNNYQIPKLKEFNKTTNSL